MTELEQQHASMVETLVKKPEEIQLELTPQTIDLVHAAIGISGEAGEILDAVKKVGIYNKPVDYKFLENIVEELGDLEFYMQQLRSALDIRREATLQANIDKLAKRYPGYKYSNKQA